MNQILNADPLFFSAEALVETKSSENQGANAGRAAGSGVRSSGAAYDLNVHLVPEDDRIGRGHRRVVDDHPDAMARLGRMSENLLGIERLPPNPEEFAEGVFPRNAGLDMDLARGVMGMEGSHPAHPIRHIRHRGVLVQRMVLPEAQVDADVRGDRRGLTVNRDCQERMRVEGLPPVDR